MVTLALRTLRYRTGGFVASVRRHVPRRDHPDGVRVAAGHRRRAGVDRATSETLTLMAGVVGGWGLLIVAFAVARR